MNREAFIKNELVLLLGQNGPVIKFEIRRMLRFGMGTTFLVNTTVKKCSFLLSIYKY